MPLVKFSDIQNKLPPNHQYIPPNTSNDGWSKAERVLFEINKMLELVMPGLTRGTGEAEAQILSNDTGAASFQSAQSAQVNPPQAQKPLIPVEIKQMFGLHLANCIKENENMSFGEMINKIPLNVLQLASLIQQLEAKYK